ncbi:MAG: sarcosine oxidase subunit gamma [Hyphomicrobiaceae bacterium]|nr:sarcosine oxidase subunit gamma [Hyphomicrobiaceae bacterium]
MSAPEPRSALSAVLRPGHSGAKGETPVALAERRLAIVQLQARKVQEAALAAAIASALGLTLPPPGQASSASETTAVWVQPGAWLVTAPFTAPGDLARRLAGAAAGLASVTDQTFGKAVLRLSGERARDVLAKGCRVDLHPRVFGPGRTAVTTIAQIGCVLVQAGEAPTFDLVVPSTLAEAFFEWLEASAAEFGCEIREPG